MQKRVVAISDISCLGKCSLTVALPIISAAGIETAVIPTAVLSTHTGGFKNYTFKDMSPDMVAIARHWKEEGVTPTRFTQAICAQSSKFIWRWNPPGL